jgi:adenylate cyclase
MKETLLGKLITHLPKSGKRWAICAVLAAGSMAATWLADQVAFFQLLHLKAFDIHFLVRGREPVPEILLVLIDQKSLDTIPDLQLFWHPYYAEAIHGAADHGAKVVGLDVAFGIPVGKWEPGHDQLMAAAVSETAARMPVVCAYVAAAMQKQRDWPVPVNMIASALGLAAYANLTVDPDDFVRRQELIEAPPAQDGEARATSLALRVAEKYLGVDAKFQAGQLMLDGAAIPISPRRDIWINYAGPPGNVPRASLSDFLAALRAGHADQVRRWVEGKVVLIGPDSAVEDRHATPFYTAFSGAQWNTAGVEIHANTIHTLLTKRFLRPVPASMRVLAMAATAAATVGIVTSLAAGGMFWLAVELVILLVGTHLLFRAGMILSTSELVLTSLFGLVFSMAYRFLTAEKRGNLFRQAVALFIGKSVASKLDEDQSLSTSATRQFVTVLFSDIRGFTSFCEERDPLEVVGLLNQYFAAMVPLILFHGGNVNKFIGDGILAVFTDEDAGQTETQAVRAVRCGIDIVGAKSQFQTGVGIHTGQAIIGNVGSADKMEHAVLGATVNLAARLESLNKDWKTTLLMSEATKLLLDNEIETACLGQVAVRGYSQPVNIYTVTALAPPGVETKAVKESES